jgi:hypothetical protein
MGVVNLIDEQIDCSNLPSEFRFDGIESAPNNPFHVTEIAVSLSKRAQVDNAEKGQKTDDAKASVDTK